MRMLLGCKGLESEVAAVVGWEAKQKKEDGGWWLDRKPGLLKGE